jgi:hypothetical protein
MRKVEQGTSDRLGRNLLICRHGLFDVLPLFQRLPSFGIVGDRFR